MSAVVIALVLIEVGPQMVDPLGEKRDLNRGAPMILIVDLVLLDEGPSLNRRYARHRVRYCLRRSPLLQGKPSLLFQ